MICGCYIVMVLNLNKWIQDKLIKSYKKFKRNRRVFHDSKDTFQYQKKQKNQHTGKLKIAFVVYMPEVWNSLKTVHDFACQDKSIETIIIAQPWISKLGAQQKEYINDAYESLHMQYVDIVNAYDVENEEWYDLKLFEPDYVFYTRPYNMEYYEAYRPENVRKYARTCWIPYGYDILRNHITDSCYNMDFMRFISTVFVPSESMKQWAEQKFSKLCRNRYLNIIYLGFPRFDLYSGFEEKQKSNDKVSILWTPRWTSENKGIMKSNFLRYYKNFFDFAEQHQEYNIIIRPHPLMFENYIKTGIMKEEDVKKLKDKCEELGNIQFDGQKDYISSVKSADIFVSDFSSLLVEFFATGNPVIYCDGQEDFAPECKIMSSYFLHANSWKEIEQNILEKCKKYQMDIKKTGILPENMGKIGKNIIEYIKSIR